MNLATNPPLAEADRGLYTPPLISLVVPVFNEGPIIRANLAAILEAAAGDWYTLELITVNDGSNDETADEITMKNAASIVTRYKKNEIAKREQMKISFMPAGLQQAMSVKDLIDLVEYLAAGCRPQAGSARPASG